jgi:hypothetical protein
MVKRLLFLVCILFSIEVFAQEAFFLYIPSEDEVKNFIYARSLLKAWDNNEISIDSELFDSMINSLGEDSIIGLQAEAFLRYTKNKNIQDKILKYIDDNKIDTPFTESLKKLYEAKETKQKIGGGNNIQYSYNNKEYDENINLFWFDEANVLNNEVGLLLFKNDWTMFNVDNPNDPKNKTSILMYGGGTNSMIMTFQKFSNVKENNINSKLKTELYNQRYKKNWNKNELPLEGILRRARADKIIMLSGTGPEAIKTIDSFTGTIYLYNKNKKVLYEITCYMNFSPINIHYSERYRIYNLLLFQLLFVFLE